MNLSRIFATAFARRIAYVVVALVLAWMGVGQVRAQDYSNCANAAVTSTYCPDQGSANVAALVAADKLVASLNADATRLGAPANFSVCGSSHVSGRIRYLVGRPTNCTAADATRYFPSTATCASRPSRTLSHPPIQSTHANFMSGSAYCDAGCAAVGVSNGDSTWQVITGASVCTDRTMETDCKAGAIPNHTWSAYTQSCQPNYKDCPANEVKDSLTGTCKAACESGKHLNAEGYCVVDKEECPAGNVKAPSGACLPGEGQCAAGEAKGKDGTCKKDADGDGVADDEDEDPDNDSDKEAFSGGDSCDAPPSCSGSPIMCGQARIQWRIDCNTRRNVNITGGACATMPVCVGKDCKAMEYAQLLQQWKTGCELEKLNAKSTGGGGDGDDRADPMEPVGSGGVLGADGYAGGDVTDKREGDIDFDLSGFGYGSSCPAMPTIDVFGTSISLDADGVFCDWMRLGGIFVMIMAHLAGLAIVVRS